MFDVHGNTITFEGQEVATIDRGWPSLRAQVASRLRDWRDPDAAYEDGHQAGYNEAEKAQALRERIRDLKEN